MIIPSVSDKDDDNTKDNKAILLPNHQGNVQVGTRLIELYTNNKKIEKCMIPPLQDLEESDDDGGDMLWHGGAFQVV